METSMEIVLYYAPDACSLVPYVTLTEAKADFEVRNLNLRKDQQKSEAYRRLNPKHKVPLLLVDGRPLSENVAIQTWIARQFPQAQLLPADRWQELEAVSVLAWCASGIHPYLSRINSTSKVCDLPGAGESVRRLAKGLLFENYKIADEMLAGREYLFDILRLRTRISFGASVAAHNSTWICPNSRIAPLTSNASSVGRVCRSCLRTRKRCERISQGRRRVEVQQHPRLSPVAVDGLSGRSGPLGRQNLHSSCPRSF
jgi:glutathione S-transferase